MSVTTTDVILCVITVILAIMAIVKFNAASEKLEKGMKESKVPPHNKENADKNKRKSKHHLQDQPQNRREPIIA